MTDPIFYRFLNLFVDVRDNVIQEIKGARFQYLRLGIMKTPVTQYNRFVISNDASHIAVKTEKHLDMAPAKYLRSICLIPLVKSVSTVSAIYWANRLLNCLDKW